MKQDVNNFFIQLSIVADTLWEDKAYVAMSKILDQFEKTSSPQECIGIDNFQQGILATIAFDLRDAKDYFNAAILEDPTNVYYWLAKYMIYLNLGLYDNCIVIAVEASLVTKKNDKLWTELKEFTWALNRRQNKLNKIKKELLR